MGDRAPKYGTPIRPDIRHRTEDGGALNASVVSGSVGSCMCVCVCVSVWESVSVCIKSRVNVQFLLPQIELNRFLNVLLGPQSHSISATLTCKLCLCHRHNGNNNNNNDISCHICLRLTQPWMIRHVCMWRSPFLSLSLCSFPFLALER